MDKKIISINFLIPIFLIDTYSEKYKITELSFKYYVYLKNLFINKINMSFTILGSEKKLSKDLVLKYFDENSYIEYDQGNINYLNRVSYDTLNTVVGNKISFGFEKAKEKNNDLIVFIKSNHFISQEWLDYLLNNFDETKNEFYVFPKESNVFVITSITSDNSVNIEETYLWDFRHMNPTNKLEACLIVIPKKIYNIYKMNPICLTEASIYNELINLGTVSHLYKNTNFHLFNIKAIDEKQNITPLLYIIELEGIKKIEKSKLILENNIYRDILQLNNLMK